MVRFRCDIVRMPDAAVIEGIRRKFEALSPVLDERSRRHWAAVEATELGWGGVSALAVATGLSRTTVTSGIQELRDRNEAPAVEATSRIRRFGWNRS